MTGSDRIIKRAGVVRAANDGCVTVEVGVPCGPCSRTGCMARQAPGRLDVVSPVGVVGERVNVSLAAHRLTRISLALFAPPLLWLAFLGLILAGSDVGLPISPAPPVIAAVGSIGLALALGLGARFGRQQAHDLTVSVTPVQ